MSELFRGGVIRISKLVCKICGNEKEIPSCCNQSMIVTDDLLCCCEKCSHKIMPKCCGEKMAFIG